MAVPEKQRSDTDSIEEGMAVEATEGDLGESDISKPRVTGVVHDQHGNVDKVVVTKGIIFKKKLEVPADRVTSVNQAKGNASSQGEVTIDATEAETAALSAAEQQTPPKKQNFFLHVLGPGFLGGMSGNDASAVTSYSVDGATIGYGHLWLLLLATPLYQAVQFSCAKIGRMTQKGLAEILRNQRVSWITNVGLVLTAVVMFAAAGLLFFGLATGQGG